MAALLQPDCRLLQFKRAHIAADCSNRTSDCARKRAEYLHTAADKLSKCLGEADGRHEGPRQLRKHGRIMHIHRPDHPLLLAVDGMQ